MNAVSHQAFATQSDSSTTRMQAAMLRSIRWYQSLRPGHPSPCRFFPSCSEYGYEAIETYGATTGGVMTLRRLLRCRPFGPSGFDPVPLPQEINPHSPTVCCTNDKKDC